jgi:hypothetical protein
MSRTLIVLRGPHDSGKTKTIGMTWEQLSNGRKKSTRGKEIRGEVLEVDSVRVGFVSLGVNAAHLHTYVSPLVEAGSEVFVCATRSTGGTVDFVADLEGKYELVWIEKSRSNSVVDQERSNRDACAEIIRDAAKALRQSRRKLRRTWERKGVSP